MDINEIKDIKTKELVQKYNFRFSKSLGQNFLIDDSVPRDIVNGADVCEICQGRREGPLYGYYFPWKIREHWRKMENSLNLPV